MSKLNSWQRGAVTLLAALGLVACGGGGGGSTSGSTVGGSVGEAPSSPVVPPSLLYQEPGAPVQTNDTAVDGRNWINFRRVQIGIPSLVRNSLIDNSAQGHSEYQKVNNTVTHNQIAGKTGFTGVTLADRLKQAGYIFTSNGYAFGEVISATSNNSGFYMAEELITAIYHRFVIFEPTFKEIGTGAASANGYHYFTTNFTANDGVGPGIGHGAIVAWPTNDQARVSRNFFSDYEAPDPVPGVNEVGYPVSVHADIKAKLTVLSFTMRPRGGTDLDVKLLTTSLDANVPASAAAIVPLSVLAGATTYEVSFIGANDGIPISKSWSFTTK